MKKILEILLKYAAKAVLKRYEPKVVGITGSVGKTSTKEAVYSVLSSKFKTRKNIKNYNNEIGLPLTIIGMESPGRSLAGWLKVFMHALNLITGVKKEYPEVLVLEMGVDHPGDMEYLSDIVQCHVGIVTTIGVSHLENFGTVAKIQKEKGLLIRNLQKSGYAILNFDDAKVKDLSKESTVRVLSYGLDNSSEITAKEINVSFEREGHRQLPRGINFKLINQGSAVPVLLPNVIGKQSIYAALAAAAAGIAFDMNMVEISRSLLKYVPPKGRMNVVAGIKDSIIIDDTYNSSPQSCTSAIRSAGEIMLNTGSKKIAVLGDMLELGSYNEPGHSEVGELAAKSGFEALVLVGENSKLIGQAAQKAGLKEADIHYFDDSESAGKFTASIVDFGDLVLVKGSQGIRMEKAIIPIMLKPEQAKDVLVRQDKEWLDQ